MAQHVEVDMDRLGRNLFTILPFFIVIFVLLYLIWDSAYTVQVHEKAVVYRFGKYHTISEPGLHFKVPVMDDVIRVNVQENELRLPFDVAPTNNKRTQQNEDVTLMLTGDLNAAIVEWTIQWRIVDPAAYLVAINEQDVVGAIRNLARSVMHEKIGDYSFDEVLVSKREEIGASARETLQQTLDAFKSGIQISGLQMQRTTPPTMVKPAFDAVNGSVQRRNQLINEANVTRNELIPKAQATKDRLIREAEGYADSRRSETEGEVSALLAQYREYKQAPEITRQRLYLEAMQEILASSGQKIVLDSDLKGLLPLLDLGAQGGRERENDDAEERP